MDVLLAWVGAFQMPRIGAGRGMRLVSAGVVLLALGLWAGVLRGALVPAPPADAVANGGFEEEAEPGTPAGWIRKARDVPEGVELVWETQRPHRGERCLGIRSTSPQDRPWFWWEQRLRLRPAQTYQLTARVRSETLDLGGVLVLSCRGEDGKELRRQHVYAFPRHSPEWGPVEVDITTPPGTVGGTLQISMHGRGALWIDDLALQPGSSRDATPLADARVYPVLRRDMPPVADGDPIEWERIPRAAVREAYAVTQAQAVVMDREESAGSADLSFAFALMSTPRELALLVEVRDDRHVTRTPYWQGDSIQVAVDTLHGRTTTVPAPGVFALGFSWEEPEAPLVVIESQPEGGSLSASDVRVGVRQDAKGYTLEAVLPWAVLGRAEPVRNEPIGFTVAVNDCDGAGRKWAEWTPGIVLGKSPAEYGTLVFAEDGDSTLCLLRPGSIPLDDLKPLEFEAVLVSLAPEPREVALELAIDGGREGWVDRRTYTLPPGVARLPLAYAAGQVPEGSHRAHLAVGNNTSTLAFDVAPLRRTVRAVEDRLRRLEHAAGELRQAVDRGRAIPVDVALPDATLTVAEHFLRWIAADVRRDGHEAIALREAERLSPLLDRALAEVARATAEPDAHPPIAAPPALAAELRGANWYVGDRPVLLIGFNQMDRDFLRDLPRLGGNTLTSAGFSAAAALLPGGTINETALRERAVAAVREAAALGLRSDIHFGHSMPRWAIEKWPDITAGKGHFMDYDIDHPEARSLTCRTIEAVARALRGEPGVTTYDLWNEAAYSAMSPRSLELFRAAMHRQYGRIERLNEAWASRYVGFAEVVPVVRDPDRPAAYTDWVRWNNGRFHDFIREMHEAVHRGDPTGRTTVKFSNEAVIVGSLNHAWQPQSTSRHNMGHDRYALAQLLDVQGCDTRPTLLSPDYAFAWRYPGMAYDLQRSMAPGKPIDDSEWHGVQTVYYDNPDQPAEFLDAALWFSYFHGVAMNLTWWWSRDGTEPKAQWFEGSLCTQPQLLDAWARNSIRAQRLAPEIVAFQSQHPRVRLLYSKPSAILDLRYLDTLRDAYETLSWFGIPIGFVTEEMLLAGFRELDLLVLPAARHASPGVREVVAELRRSGVEVVSVGADCLTLTPHGRPLTPAVPIASATLADAGAIPAWAAFGGPLRHPLRCLGPDGVSSKPVAFRTVRHNGRTLAYLIGLGKEAASVRVERDGHPARSRSLIDGKSFRGERLVRPFDVDLLVIDP